MGRLTAYFVVGASQLIGLKCELLAMFARLKHYAGYARIQENYRAHLANFVRSVRFLHHSDDERSDGYASGQVFE